MAKLAPCPVSFRQAFCFMANPFLPITGVGNTFRALLRYPKKNTAAVGAGGGLSSIGSVLV